MKSNFIYRILENPFIYCLSQVLIAPGANKFIEERLKKLQVELPRPKKVLDVGCGPSSKLWRIGLKPIGLDICYDYTMAFRKNGDSLVGSSFQLPFADDSFDGVWTIGLLHHLRDEIAKRSIDEMCRVSARYVVIWDAVMPELLLTRPIAYIIRRMDRGKYVRRQNKMISILPKKQKWNIHRFTYSFIGHEMIECIYFKK